MWDVLAAFGDLARWAPNVDHSCLLTAQAEGVGTARRVQAGRATLVETVTVWEPGASLAYLITGLPRVIRSVTNTWHLRPAGEGTSVTLTTAVDAGRRPPQRLAAAIVARKLGGESDRMLAGLATSTATNQPDQADTDAEEATAR